MHPNVALGFIFGGDERMRLCNCDISQYAYCLSALLCCGVGFELQPRVVATTKTTRHFERVFVMCATKCILEEAVRQQSKGFFWHIFFVSSSHLPYSRPPLSSSGRRLRTLTRFPSSLSLPSSATPLALSLMTAMEPARKPFSEAIDAQISAYLRFVESEEAKIEADEEVRDAAAARISKGEAAISRVEAICDALCTVLDGYSDVEDMMGEVCDGFSSL